MGSVRHRTELKSQYISFLSQNVRGFNRNNDPQTLLTQVYLQLAQPVKPEEQKGINQNLAPEFALVLLLALCLMLCELCGLAT